jgi:mono/diheme cytochrome c family protein
MRFAYGVIALTALLAGATSIGHLETAQEGERTVPPDLKRGQYLVEDVAMCWTCHTPRTENGQPDRGRWLMGGPVPYRPATPTAEWAEIAPRLAGLPPGTDEQFITLLTTGIARTGRPPRPPMPQFRMTRQDAQRVLAYLKSVKPSE